jgi:hypothetical protein
MRNRPPRNVLDYCIAKGGLRVGLQVATFIVAWSMAQAELGESMTLEDAADWWREAHRTWYRRLSDYRRLFPGSEFPTDLAAAAIADVDRRLLSLGAGLSRLAQLPAPSQVLVA